MYKIGELSKLCNISVKTLRFYDAQGLLIPDEIDRFTGYRYYSAAKLAECYRIIALKELGFTLEEIRAQLAAKEDNERIVASLDGKVSELNDLIESTQKQLRRIETMKTYLTQGESTMFNIIIRTEDTLRVAYLRGTYPHKSDALSAAEKIASALPRAMVGKRRVIINYEIEYREEDFDLAACVEIIGKMPKGAPYEEKVITYGKSVASLICHKEALDEAYQAMIRHLNEICQKPCGAYYEIYHDDGTVELKVPVCPLILTSAAPAEDQVLPPFEDDPAAFGKWQLLDIVPTREHFVYGKPKCEHPDGLTELCLIDGGQPYWVVQGWTKGYLFFHSGMNGSVRQLPYTIESDGTHTLLFLSMNRESDGIYPGYDVPELYVYEQIECRHYTSADELRKCDNVDLPFVDDPVVLGAWNVVDFVKEPDLFEPTSPIYPREHLMILQFQFEPDGILRFTTKQKSNSTFYTWTAGYVLSRHNQTASAYDIRTIDGKEYMFWEWKSGDYIYGKRKPLYYVFVKE